MTATFQHPFQCIRHIERRLAGLQNLLLASSGPKIYSYAAGDGKRLSVWPQNADEKSKNSTEAPTAGPSTEPPEKKRKMSASGDDTAEDRKNASQASGDHQPPVAWSNIPLLVPTTNAKHLVAVTAEDKCVRVLGVGEDGILQQLSARQMPKRPSSVVLACEDTIILCGDKFGDVYSMPLLPNEEKSDERKKSRHPQMQNRPKPSQPAATNLTVHTQRNLNALEQQLKHPSKSSSEKHLPSFEHKLLLGHVSMLTDLAFVSLPSGASNHPVRQYILTADRDEHIRVSRGPTQAYIIENYCLGHTSFVSKLCIPQFLPEILISGGGDDYLLVWKWDEGRVLQKVPLVDQSQKSAEVTVRGIWSISFADSADITRTSNLILVALEGSSELLVYLLQSDNSLKLQSSIRLSGNILDVTSNEAEGTILVSVDCVRESGSTQAWRKEVPSPQVLVEAFRVKSGPETLAWEPIRDSTIANVNHAGTTSIPTTVEGKQKKELDESLYSLERLRKTLPTDNE